jgi:hypothetical protein
MKSVWYTEQRPHAIDTPEEYMATLDVPGHESAKKIVDKLLYTKSSEWGYEEELRLAIPDGVKAGESAGYYPFLDPELIEMYLGYRMTEERKAGIIRLARAVNPAVRVFGAHLAKRKYVLGFDSI